MQIDSRLPTTSPMTTPVATSPATNSAAAASDSATPSVTSAALSQDDAVNISADGAALAAQSAQTAQTADTTQDSAATDSGDAKLDSDASAVKSFAYGSLGLERPDQPQSDSNTFYTAGRWLAAGITVGGLVSLLI